MALTTVCALVYTTRHLGIDTDTSNMIDARLPHRQAHLAYRAAFPQLSSDIVVFTEAASAGIAEDAADQIALKLRAMPATARVVIRPGGGEFFETNGLLYLSIDELWALDDRLNTAEPLLGTLAKDPSLRGLLATFGHGLEAASGADQQALLIRMFDQVSAASERLLAGTAVPISWRDQLFANDAANPGPHRAFVMIDPVVDTMKVQPALKAVESVRLVVREVAQANPSVRIRITGDAVMNGEELVTVAEDAKFTTLLSFVCVTLVIIVGLRSGSLLSAVLISLACGLIWTAAFATFFVGALNIISVCFAVLFIGMGVDFGIQFSMRYLEGSDRGLARSEALIAAGRDAGGALALAAVGAAISFLAFVPTSYQGLAQLGVISGGSMVIAWFLNLSLLPALLSRLPVPTRRNSDRANQNQASTSWAGRHFKVILGLSALGVIVSLLLLPRARFDLNPLNLKDASTDGVAAFRDLALDPTNTPYSIHLLAPSLVDADQLARTLGELPTVDKVITLSKFVPEDQGEKLEIISALQLTLSGALEPSTLTPPTSEEEIAAMDLFIAALSRHTAAPEVSPEWTISLKRLEHALTALMSHRAWPTSLVPLLRTQLIGDLPAVLVRLSSSLNAQAISLDSLPDELRDQYIARDGQARVQVIPRENLNDNAAMKNFAVSVQSIAPGATDAPIELYVGSRVVIKACVMASAGALVLTILLHIFVLHGVVDALLVAAPLLLAMLLTVATSVVFDVPFNFANIIALPLLIGLNNAYGAYLVVRNHATGNVRDLLASSTPRAVLFSGLTAIASFGALGFSKHPGMAGMGILISVSLSYAIIAALVVLPAIMAAREHYITSRLEKE